MKEPIAPCGLYCSTCDSYVATRKNDREALARLAEQWGRQFGFAATADNVRCTGCMSKSGVQIGHCAECAIRLCAIDKKHSTCAECEDYGCAKLVEFTAQIPDAKKRLDALRR